MAARRLPFGLCAWGLTYNLGLQGSGTPRANPNPKPKDASWLLRLSDTHHLAHVELSSGVISTGDKDEELKAYRKEMDQLGSSIVLSGPALHGATAGDSWKRCFEQAAILGARTIRTTLSSVLCGERKLIGGLAGWEARMAECSSLLRGLGPQAESRGLRIAIENHQDATSWDLMRLCEESGSPAVGVTLDCGNPLAVGEGVLAFAKRILPRLFHAHLKDYTLHANEHGYLLARCPIGAGVVPYPALATLFSTMPGLTLSLELSALEGRPIRVLDEDWWKGFPPRDQAEAQEIQEAALRTDPKLDPRTPWEKGLGDLTCEYEINQVAESVGYLEKIWPPRT